MEPAFIPSAPEDSALQDVFEAVKTMDPDGRRLARVTRQTFDQLYDGQRTGRFRLDQLHKTEKTHFGTLFEINLQREFSFEEGRVLDFRIAGHEVDSKYSHTGQWMLPPESFEQLVMVAKADDKLGTWSFGLVRVTEANRRTSANRDRKTGLNTLGRSRILWLFQDEGLPPNILQQLPEATVDLIMSHRGGQARVNELFRNAVNVPITRSVIATVAQQADYMKRVRENGGARSSLRPEGLLILSGDYSNQRDLAWTLGATVPQRGELVSVKVVPTDSQDGTIIEGELWQMVPADHKTLRAAPRISASTPMMSRAEADWETPSL